MQSDVQNKINAVELQQKVIEQQRKHICYQRELIRSVEIPQGPSSHPSRITTEGKPQSQRRRMRDHAINPPSRSSKSRQSQLITR